MRTCTDVSMLITHVGETFGTHAWSAGPYMSTDALRGTISRLSAIAKTSRTLASAEGKE